MLDTLDPKYRVVLCDIWGCIHDGISLYPGVVERLRRWKDEGRTVVLITNAPRTAEAVAGQLARLGLDPALWDAIATSGEDGIARLIQSPRPVGFIGTRADREILEGKSVAIADGDDFTDLACTGLEEGRPHADQYAGQLADWVGRGVVMHCLNPDRLVIRGGVPEACAGALADVYEALGGRVAWYGKPHKAIYEHALHLADDPAPDAVLAIGDGLHTDMLGAARMGFDSVFVTGGIHAGEPFPPDFARQEGLGDWHPVAIVDSLG